MDYALINSDVVQNVVTGDAAYAQSIAADWQAVVDVTNTVPQPGIGWGYVNSQFVAPTPEPEPVPVQKPRHISVGAFFDRFGSEKINILSSTDTVVQALVRDASVRKYIDLDRPDLVQAMQLLVSKGFAIDPQAILSAPVQPNEAP